MRCLRAATATAALLLVWANPSAAAPPRASVELSVCSASQDQSGTATFTGTMRAFRDTRGMALRFTLLERRGSGEYQVRRVPGLGVWRRAPRGIRTFRFEQDVDGLYPGRAYRMLVHFRWKGADGVTRRGLRSAPCRQPAPNLRVRRIEVESGPTDDSTLYRVTVVNSGSATATHFGVSLLLNPDGPQRYSDESEIRELMAGDEDTVEFTVVEARCEGEVEAVVDPGNDVVEGVERDNTRSRDCVRR
jgi:hypothetical protein